MNIGYSKKGMRLIYSNLWIGNVAFSTEKYDSSINASLLTMLPKMSVRGSGPINFKGQSVQPGEEFVMEGIDYPLFPRNIMMYETGTFGIDASNESGSTIVNRGTQWQLLDYERDAVLKESRLVVTDFKKFITEWSNFNGKQVAIAIVNFAQSVTGVMTDNYILILKIQDNIAKFRLEKLSQFNGYDQLEKYDVRPDNAVIPSSTYIMSKINDSSSIDQLQQEIDRLKRAVEELTISSTSRFVSR